MPKRCNTTPVVKARALLRVLIVSPHPLLGQAMETWLRQQQGIDIVGWEEDVEKAGESIDALKPDVVVFDTSGIARTSLGALMCKLTDRPGARIFSINMEDNNISFFGSQEQKTECMELLLDAMRGIPSDSHAEQERRSPE